MSGYTHAELIARSERLAKMEKDARLELLEAIGEKIEELAKEMRNCTITFADKDDKAFDRTMKTMMESKTISDNYKYLRLEIGLTKDTGDMGRVKNPIEASAKNQFSGKKSHEANARGDEQPPGAVAHKAKSSRKVDRGSKVGVLPGKRAGADGRDEKVQEATADPF